jgi:hypothetical protein
MEATTGTAKESYASAMVAAAGKFDAAAMEAVAGVTKESDLTNGRGSPPTRRSRAQQAGIPARGTSNGGAPRHGRVVVVRVQLHALSCV